MHFPNLGSFPLEHRGEAEEFTDPRFIDGHFLMVFVNGRVLMASWPNVQFLRIDP